MAFIGPVEVLTNLASLLLEHFADATGVDKFEILTNAENLVRDIPLSD